MGGLPGCHSEGLHKRLPLTERRILKNAGVIFAGLGGLAVLLITTLRKQTPASSAPSTTQKNPCDDSPPSPQPKIPAGFTVYRGPIDEIAQGVANNLLGASLGEFVAFTDGEGRKLGALSLWHCKPSRGWHKGVTLFQKA